MIPNAKYLHEFMRLKCAPDLLAARVYPNLKEITESFAAYRAVVRVLGHQLKDPSVLVYCVGDGHTPRTAVCFALRSAWTAVAIDPLLGNPDGWERKFRRLYCERRRVEDVQDRGVPGNTRVVVAVHSHARLEVCAKFDPAVVVALPCCVPQKFGGRPPDHTYDDWGVWSPRRTVLVWTQSEGRNTCTA